MRTWQKLDKELITMLTECYNCDNQNDVDKIRANFWKDIQNEAYQEGWDDCANEGYSDPNV